jgi:hypothetical protein
MPDATATTQPNLTSTVPRFRDAYQHLLDEIRKVPDTEIVTINIDVPTAVTTALGVLPEIRTFRPQIATDIPSFDLARFDKLESYTLALGHAHTLYLAASNPPESISDLSDSGTKARELLLSDATALAARGFIDGEKLKTLKGPHGYRNLAFDLFTLASLLRDNWDRIAGKTAVQTEELDQAETLADRLLTAVGMKEQQPVVAAESSDIRQRAFSLFVNAYDDARRAVSYLRWHQGDVDEVAPSLYAGRGGNTKRKPEPQPPAPAPDDSEPTQKPSPANTKSGAVSATPAAVSGGNLPGGDPFAHT